MKRIVGWLSPRCYSRRNDKVKEGSVCMTRAKYRSEVRWWDCVFGRMEKKRWQGISRLQLYILRQPMQTALSVKKRSDALTWLDFVGA